MKQKSIFLNLFLFFCFLASAQKVNITKIVADEIVKTPLEKVIVFNEKDISLTNTEGVFSFVSDIEILNFALIGYEDLKLSFDEIKKKDTIFLKRKMIELDEVIIGNELSILKKAFSNLKENYSTNPYNENFFLRCVLKRNDEISRLQDIYGKVSRKSFFKTKTQPDNKCEVEILNMRKIGITEKSDLVYFKFQSFENLFDLNSLIQINVDEYELQQEKDIASDYWKISFVQKEINSRKQKIKGHFIIKKTDYAFVQTCFDFYDNPEEVPYSKDGKVMYRTTSFRRISNYKRDDAFNKYYLSNANSVVRVEILESEKNPKAYYDFTSDYFVTNSFISSKTASNLSMDKDIFKVKFAYSDQFWANQNQLPLTNNLKEFLSRVSANKERKKEYDVIGNF
ncbi:hypothetical protein ACFSJW_09495 [Flavobacterium artemisiae]|uniref:CarboxypepD_reg-like domain-containing protein n=1 Tax=Flavobacterium artemisiae TaxID=2126556 RepID=A0ABW4HEG2_9FLAO